MRIHPIHESYGGASAIDVSKLSQLKPPLHTIQQHYRRNEHAINEIMEDVLIPHETDILSGTTQQITNEQPIGGNNIHDDDDDDFMARIVDGTCRGIFSSSGNDDDDHDGPSLCHLPSCQLGENLNVLMVCLF
jgi:hypothetical protein